MLRQARSLPHVRLLLAVCWLSANLCAAQEPARVPMPPRSMSLSSAGSPVAVPASAVLPVPSSDGTRPVALGMPTAAAAQAVTQTQPQPRPGTRPSEEVSATFRVRLDLPGPEELFRLDSEDTLFNRMKQEAREKTPPERITFPEEPILSRQPYYGRSWPLSKMFVEPSYLCHRRLLFEQINQERYGWDFGIVAPFLSTGVFFKDCLLLPYHLGTQPCRHFECSAGKCLPGDPVPLLLYPPELSLTGTLAEGAAIATLEVLFP
ncbi:MAG: hypothetical protein HYS12_25800 [Planctomycetes bacterium]|nr:hypothetical protein [Planctomycetota bacterium]